MAKQLCTRVASMTAETHSAHNNGPPAETVLWAKVKGEAFQREKAGSIFLQENGHDSQIEPCSWSEKVLLRGKRTHKYPSQKGEGRQFLNRFFFFFFQDSFSVA